MRVQKAKEYFLGCQAGKKLNCGQAVVAVFGQDREEYPHLVAEFASYGGGRAPEGECGAYYALRVMLSRWGQSRHEQVCREHFVSAAGAIRCADIRRQRKLSCVGCVEQAAGCLEKISSATI
jgi:hypothetical protein